MRQDDICIKQSIFLFCLEVLREVSCDRLLSFHSLSLISSLVVNNYHFYIWCLIDNDDKPHFLVMSVKNFKRVMGNSLKGISFFKDQDRQHFSSKTFGKWSEFLNKFKKLN